MKNILIPLLFFLISNPIAAQIELHVGTDHTVNLNDPVVIRLLDHVGDVQWQRSFNSYDWQDIQGAQADSLYLIADITSYFRAKVTAGHCEPFYSDTTLITVAGETPGQGVIGPEGGVISYDDESSPIHGAFIFIPAGALEESTHIEISLASDTLYFPGDSSAVIVSFEPSNLFFQEYVTIGIPFSDNADMTNLGAYYYEPDSLIIYQMPVIDINVNDRILISQTKHFSCFTATDSGANMNIEMLNINNKIGVRLKLLELDKVKTSWNVFSYPNVWNYILNNLSRSHIVVDLYEKRSFWADNLIETKIMFFNRNVGGAVFQGDVLKGFDETLVYTTPYLGAYGPDSNLAVWHSGEPFIFYFHEFSPDPNREYYVKIRWFLRRISNNRRVTPYYDFDNKTEKLTTAFMTPFDIYDLHTSMCIDQKYIGGNLPEVSLNSITNITQNSVSVSSEIISQGSSTVSSRGVCLSTRPNPSVLDICSEDGTGLGSFTSHISPLSAQTNYYIRSYATNSSGTAYSTQQTFKTLPAGIAYVNTLSVSDITHNSASAIGTVANQGSVPVTAKGFVWATTEGPTLQSNLGYSVGGYGTGGFSTLITDLLPGTTYYIKAYATNSIATAYGEQVSFKTLAPPTVTTHAVTGVGSTSAASGGNVTDDGGATVTARGIAYNTSPSPTINDNTVLAGSGTGTFSALMTGLSPSTTYYVRAYATNIAGTSYGDQHQFTTTSQITTPSVTTAPVTNITQNSATSGGNVTNSGGATVNARGICYSTSTNPTINDNIVSAGSGTGSFTAQMTGLTPGTTYHVRAYATNSQGTAYGTNRSFTAGSGYVDGDPCPGIPTVTDVDGNTYNTVQIGDQCWMRENLKTTKYRNGIPLDHPIDNAEWGFIETGAYAWYNNDYSNKNKYGALYNWFAVDNANGLCPVGWRVASDTDWTELTNYIGGSDSPNGNKLKSCRQVNSPIEGCNTNIHPRWNASSHYGIDEFGFEAVPGGSRWGTGTYHSIGTIAVWWTSTEQSSTRAWGRAIYSGYGHISRNNLGKSLGHSVRCIKD